jgi:hypothetical protein
MTSDAAVSDNALGLADIDRLRHAGLIPAVRYAEASRLVRDDAYWASWGRRAILAVGLAQFLAGIIFFFAYNWAALPELAKFAIVEGAIVLAALGALFFGLERPLGRALLVTASVLVGVLLAIVGQAYQTGADVYELFMAWAVLILPWAIISRSAALWLTWFVIAEFAVSLFAAQVLVTLDMTTIGQATTLSGLVPVAGLVAREVAVRLGCDWLSSRWTRLVPLGLALGGLFCPAAGYAVDYYESTEDLASAVVFVAALAALFATYRRLLPDYAALVMGIGVAIFFIILGVRIIETVGSISSATTNSCGDWLMVLWAGLGTGCRKADAAGGREIRVARMIGLDGLLHRRHRCRCRRNASKPRTRRVCLVRPARARHRRRICNLPA